jgi:large repetitive protein
MRYLTLVVVLAFARVCSAGTPPPTITGVSPNSGPSSGGTVVAITGTNFTGASAVDFGVTPALSFTVLNSTSVSATSPAGVNPVDITITTQFGTNATGPADQFTYLTTPVRLQSFNVD